MSIFEFLCFRYYFLAARRGPAYREGFGIAALRFGHPLDYENARDAQDVAPGHERQSWCSGTDEVANRQADRPMRRAPKCSVSEKYQKESMFGI